MCMIEVNATNMRKTVADSDEVLVPFGLGTELELHATESDSTDLQISSVCKSCNQSASEGRA